MCDVPKCNTLAELERLHGKPVPVSVFAMMAHRSRNTIYQRIERGTLPACYLGGLLCVLVNGEAIQPASPLPSSDFD